KSAFHNCPTGSVYATPPARTRIGLKQPPQLFTVTETAVALPRFPAASRATAVSVCEPLPAVVVSQVVVYGAAVTSPPRLAPSNWNCTPATPTLSLADAVTLVEPVTVWPAAGAVIETVGAVLSEGGGTGGGGA